MKGKMLFGNRECPLGYRTSYKEFVFFFSFSYLCLGQLPLGFNTIVVTVKQLYTCRVSSVRSVMFSVRFFGGLPLSYSVN